MQLFETSDLKNANFMPWLDSENSFHSVEWKVKEGR